MKIVERKIDELIVSEYNPRKLNMKDFKALKDSLRKYGFLDPLIVNVNPERKDVIIGGHQRREAWKELGKETIPTIEVNLSIEDEKELNIRLNRSAGAFDINLLGIMFSKDKLLEIGFNESELSKIETEFEKTISEFDNSNCEYPIVPKFNEKYDYILIVCENEMDNLRLRTLLTMEKQKSYKNFKTPQVGKGTVISYDNFETKMKELYGRNS